MSTTSTVKYLGSLRTQPKHTRSGKVVVTDAPIDNKGKGEAFSPTDLCATSLASCVMTIMGIKANNTNIDLGEINADVFKIMASNPRRISEVRIQFQIEGRYTDEEKRSLELAGRNCPVAKSLHPNLVQDLQFVWSQR